MTDCILKSCARETPCRNTCGAAFALDLAGQRDGYLVAADDPVVVALRKARLVITRPAGAGYVIVKKFDPDATYRAVHSSRWSRAPEIGAVIAAASLQGDVG